MSQRERGGQESNLGLLGFNEALGPSQLPLHEGWFREQDSNPHLRVQSAAACRVLADPGMTPSVSPGQIPVREVRLSVASLRSLAVVGIGVPVVSLTRVPAFPPQPPSRQRPRTPHGTVRVLPSGAGAIRTSPARTRTSLLPPRRADVCCGAVDALLKRLRATLSDRPRLLAGDVG